MFSDPADVAPNGVKPEDLYPNTIFLPGTGIQRGSTDLGDGDPLSQGWPSVPNAYRYVIKNIIQFGNCEDINHSDYRQFIIIFLISFAPSQ